jgi:hypothetical protein
MITSGMFGAALSGASVLALIYKTKMLQCRYFLLAGKTLSNAHGGTQ